MSALYLVKTAFGSRRITLNPMGGSYPDTILRQANVRDCSAIMRIKTTVKDDLSRSSLHENIPYIQESETTDLDKTFEELGDTAYSMKDTIELYIAGPRNGESICTSWELVL